jgi:catechol 2,3-dioxygenase-like lactoylglutathione lyase family enzyme
VIHHVSFDVDDPARAAATLARLVGGHVVPGVPFPWSCMVAVPDGNGTAFELYPRGRAVTAEPTTHFVDEPGAAGPSSFHVAVSVKADLETIRTVAAEAGWICRVRPGPFDVIEVWIDGRRMIELLTPEMTARYLEVAGGIGSAGRGRGELPPRGVEV